MVRYLFCLVANYLVEFIYTRLLYIYLTPRQSRVLEGYII
jgi:hypothetical protein